MKKQLYSYKELEEYRDLQRLAYEAVVHVEERLYRGITEKQAAKMVEGVRRRMGGEEWGASEAEWFRSSRERA